MQTRSYPCCNASCNRHSSDKFQQRNNRNDSDIYSVFTISKRPRFPVVPLTRFAYIVAQMNSVIYGISYNAGSANSPILQDSQG